MLVCVFASKMRADQWMSQHVVHLPRHRSLERFSLVKPNAQPCALHPIACSVAVRTRLDVDADSIRSFRNIHTKIIKVECALKHHIHVAGHRIHTDSIWWRKTRRANNAEAQDVSACVLKIQTPTTIVMRWVFHIHPHMGAAPPLEFFSRSNENRSSTRSTQTAQHNSVSNRTERTMNALAHQTHIQRTFCVRVFVRATTHKIDFHSVSISGD